MREPTTESLGSMAPDATKKTKKYKKEKWQKD